jgi:PAS domain S-box-containing protein
MIVDANPAAEALSGRTLAELQLLHHTQLHPLEVEKVAGSWFDNNPQALGLIQDLVLHKDGGRIPVEISSSHFTTPDGRRIVVAVFRDLTERTLAEAKLQESERRFRVTFSQAAVGIAQTALDGHWLLLNDRFCEIFGYSREELARKTFLEITHPDDREVSLTAIRQLLSGEISSWSTEKRYVRNDAVIIWGKCFLSLVRDEQGRARYFIAVVEDITQRIEAERALRQAEQRLTLAQSAAHLGVWYRDWVTNEISISGEYARLHGLAPDRTMVTRDEWFSTIHPDDRERVEALRREARERTHTFEAEYRVVWPDGSVHWVMAKGAVLLDDSGRPIGTTGVTMDITERKEAEGALRNNEQQLVSIYNTVRDVIFRLAVEYEGQFRFVSVNEAFMRVTGLSREAVVGKMVNEVIPQLSLAMVLGKYRQAVEGKTIVSWEETTDYPAGRLTGEVSIAPVLDDKGTCTHLVGSAHDITERKRAEAALRESEERFRTMADTAPVMIWVTGPDKLVTFVNKTFLDFTGRTLELELGKGWVAGIHPEDLERCSEIFHSSFDARRNFHIEFRVRRADGKYRWVVCSGVPRFGPDGVFAGYIGSDLDITDLRRAQEETLARQKLESLGVLAGGIAHDFNNLLGAILANVELVLEELPRGSLAHGGLEAIKGIAVRATEIVRQMMAYAGQESGAFESVNLSRLVGDMLQLLKVSISKTARLKVDLPKNVPAVRCNAAQIQQVLMNLITNASEALGEKEGAISVSVTQVRLGTDSREPNSSQGDYVRLEVNDTGCGMPEEIQARIFDPFFTTKFAGRGLGLAAVQGIIRNHGGIINVTSAPGQGSRFEVLLPGAGQTAAGGVAEPPLGGEVGNFAGTVLVIEDEDALRLAIAKMLRRKALTVIEAADGKTGIDLFRAGAGQIDVVLLDLTLPGIPGAEVLGELRRIRPNVKVLITSAYSRDWVADAIGEQQPWFYIRKPYLFSDLIGLVRDVCLARVNSQAYTQ